MGRGACFDNLLAHLHTHHLALRQLLADGAANALDGPLLAVADGAQVGPAQPLVEGGTVRGARQDNGESWKNLLNVWMILVDPCLGNALTTAAGWSPFGLNGRVGSQTRVGS